MNKLEIFLYVVLAALVITLFVCAGHAASEYSHCKDMGGISVSGHCLDKSVFLEAKAK